MDEAVGADNGQIDRQAQQHEAEGGQRSRRGDLEVLARRGGVPAHLGQAAEQEQVDAADPDAVAAGHQRVAKLVHDQRCEQDEHGDHRGQVRHAIRAVQSLAKLPRQQEDHQE